MNNKGFTLIELLIVITIIATLAVLIIPNFTSAPSKAKVTAAKSDISSLKIALQTYMLDNGRLPTTEQGLKALIEKPATPPVPTSYQAGGYLDLRVDENEVLDPWGTPYKYEIPGPAGKAFQITSFGADAKEGGEDYDADITVY